MVMTSIEIKIPETIRQYVLDETTEKVRNAMLLYPSVANDTISHGKAAELLGLSKMELIQIYGKLGLPYLDMSDQEFEEEVRTVKRLGEKV